MTDAAAPGWYPDPGGSRAWRRFDGASWTTEVEPYGEPRPPLSERLEAIAAQDALARYGAVLLFGGAGLLIDLYHHRGSGQLAPSTFAVFGVVATAMIVVGHAAYARAAYALSHRPWLSALPAANLVWWARSAALHLRNLPWSHSGTRSARANVGDLVVLQAVGVMVLIVGAVEPLPRTEIESVVVHLVPAVMTLINVMVAVDLRADLVD